jgi:acetolactate synthase small subunit
MVAYSCKICMFHSDNKSKYERHLKTIKHREKEKYEDDYIGYVDDDMHSCKYCGKIYKHKQSLTNHIKYNCDKNKDEDIKELVRLLNLQLEQKDDRIKTLSHHMEKQQRQIDKLMDKLKVTNITNHTTNHIQNNIQLLSYKDTDTSHLTHEDYMESIMKVTYCVKHLIEKIHFNPDKPENMNIYISNMKDKYIMIYENGNWRLKNKNTELDTLYDTKEMLLEDWIHEEQHNYPELKIKFEKYLNNREEDEIMNSIKEDIKLMLYNNKKLVEN